MIDEGAFFDACFFFSTWSACVSVCASLSSTVVGGYMEWLANHQYAAFMRLTIIDTNAFFDEACFLFSTWSPCGSVCVSLSSIVAGGCVERSDHCYTITVKRTMIEDDDFFDEVCFFFSTWFVCASVCVPSSRTIAGNCVEWLMSSRYIVTVKRTVVDDNTFFEKVLFFFWTTFIGACISMSIEGLSSSSTVIGGYVDRLVSRRYTVTVKRTAINVVFIWWTGSVSAGVSVGGSSSRTAIGGYVERSPSRQLTLYWRPTISINVSIGEEVCGLPNRTFLLICSVSMLLFTVVGAYMESSVIRQLLLLIDVLRASMLFVMKLQWAVQHQFVSSFYLSLSEWHCPLHL